ncbi:MAG: exosortase [Bryobacteraceae bacterium]|jgi:exosortase
MMRRIVVLVTALTLVVCYAPVLRGMFDQWWNDEDMSHGLVVPVVIFWIVWRERKRWMTLPARPSWWGLALLALAGCVQLMSVMGAGLFAGSVAFLLSVAGAVLCLGGPAFLRTWAFPLLLALFMLPKLAIVYNQVTLPLQLLASRMAEVMLLAGGASVIREGNIIDAGGHRVAVAEACSGIRYLLSLGFVAVLLAYLSDAKPWMRVALLAAAVPVAILANAIRVAASASVPALDAGALHAFAGCLVFVLCMAMLAVVRQLLNAAYARYHA